MRTGNVEIILPENKKITICCSKVGYMKNGEFVLEDSYLKSNVKLNMLRSANQMEEAAKRLEAYVESGFLVEPNTEGVARIEDLEEGVYLLNCIDFQNEYTMTPTLLFLPTWNEVEEKMLYDITVVPKYGQKEIGPMTGDTNHGVDWIIVLLLSSIVLAWGWKKSKKRGLFFK